MTIISRLNDRCYGIICNRPADFLIGGHDEPYLARWLITPWSGLYRDISEPDKTLWQKLVSRLPGVYLHEFYHSDDDRALHDHPWVNVSLVLDGQYHEHTIRAGGINVRHLRRAGSMVFRRASAAHRVELVDGKPCRSLFFFGFRLRNWGFHCAERGWVPWAEFVSPYDRGAVGKGCGEP